MGDWSSSLDSHDHSGDAPTVEDRNAPAALRKEERLVPVEKEVEFRVDYVNGLGKTCFKKCIDKRYKEAELYIGENSCIDRCIAKYLQILNFNFHQFLFHCGSVIFYTALGIRNVATSIIGQILASQRPST